MEPEYITRLRVANDAGGAPMVCGVIITLGYELTKEGKRYDFRFFRNHFVRDGYLKYYPVIEICWSMMYNLINYNMIGADETPLQQLSKIGKEYLSVLKNQVMDNIPDDMGFMREAISYLVNENIANYLQAQQHQEEKTGKIGSRQLKKMIEISALLDRMEITGTHVNELKQRSFIGKLRY